MAYQQYIAPDVLRDRAWEFAIESHWGQMYGTKPYTHHLAQVAQICADHKLPDYVIAAAMLHDVVEDTDVTADQVAQEFGYEVATLVYSVTDADFEFSEEEMEKLKAYTDPKYIKQQLRKRKKALTYPKILSHPYGVHLKLADRIANVSSCSTAKDTGMFEMYCKEAIGFEEKLKTPGIAENMWAKLDGVYGKYKSQIK